jgi:hypothetical protein
MPSSFPQPRLIGRRLSSAFGRANAGRAATDLAVDIKHLARRSLSFLCRANNRCWHATAFRRWLGQFFEQIREKKRAVIIRNIVTGLNAERKRHVEERCRRSPCWLIEEPTSSPPTTLTNCAARCRHGQANGASGSGDGTQAGCDEYQGRMRRRGPAPANVDGTQNDPHLTARCARN